MSIVVLDGQSMFDIAMQFSGAAEAVSTIALENNISITDELGAGQELKLSGTPLNKNIAEYYKNNKIEPATSSTSKLLIERIFDDEFENDFE